MMRSSDYARTPPEAPEGLPVFVVSLVFVIMARELMWSADRRQRPSEIIFQSDATSKISFKKVELDVVVTQ
jgi:hypothetical protein